MLYLFNSAARVGYVENVLNTLFLPRGAENVYQYSLNSGSYIHPEINEGFISGTDYIDKDILILFVNKDGEDYQYIPMRKAELLRKEDIDGRSYFTVIMKDYCVAKNGVDYFNKNFISAFEEKMFKVNPEEGKIDTKQEKHNRGYLAFTGPDFSSYVNCGDDCWYKTVCLLKDVAVFKNANAIFTKLVIKEKINKLNEQKINEPGKPVYKFIQGKEYNAELSYYVPFHDNDVGSYLEVQLIPNPVETRLSGGALVQRLNVMQGVANFRFVASAPCKNGEIVLKINRIYSEKVKEAKMAWRGVNFTIRRGVKRYLLIIALIIISTIALLGTNYCSTLINKADKTDDINGWYYVITAICTLCSSGLIWITSWLFNKKE